MGEQAQGDVKGAEAQAQIDTGGPSVITIHQWSIPGHQKHEPMPQEYVPLQITMGIKHKYIIYLKRLK